ncbi:hypothetical protein ACVWW1_006013 [Bradyrhizobium sp. JR3.5]
MATASPGPADGTVGGQHELLVGGGAQFLGTRIDLARQHLLGGGLQRLGVAAGLGRIRCEGETIEPADHVAFHDHFTGLANFRIQN